MPIFRCKFRRLMSNALLFGLALVVLLSLLMLMYCLLALTVYKPYRGDLLNRNELITRDVVDDMPHFMRRDIVIGLAQNVKIKYLAIFCNSSREHLPFESTDIVIFVNSPLNVMVTELSRSFHIQLIEYNASNIFNGLTSFHRYHPSTLRWRLIYDYFSDIKNRLLYIMFLF